MNKHFIAAAAAVILSTAAVPSLASTALASLSDFRIQLIDLDTGDGIVPSLVFQDVQGGSFVAAESGRPGSVTTDVHAGGSVFGAASSASTQGAASAFGSMAGDPFGRGAAATASASTDLRGLYGASTVQLGDGAIYAPFTLSAQTRLVITADANASALSTFDEAHADTWASVFLKLTDATGLGSVSTDSASAEQFSTLGASPVATTDTRQIDISFENLTGAGLGGIFYGSIDAYAADLVPVPEPGNLPLMLGALGLLAWRGRQSSR